MYPSQALPAAGCARSILALHAAFDALQRRVWLAAWCFIAIAVLVACAWWNWPRRYVSEAKLLAPLRLPASLADGVSAHDAVPTPSTKAPGRSGADALRAQLWNEAALAQVVAAVGDEAILGKPGAWSWLHFGLPQSTAIATDPRDRRALTMKALLSRLHVAPVANADLLELTYVADAPETAQRTLQQLLDVACAVPAGTHEVKSSPRLAEQPTRQASDPMSGTTALATQKSGAAQPTPSGGRQEELFDRLKIADDAHSEIADELTALRARIRQLHKWLEHLSFPPQSPLGSPQDLAAAEDLRLRLNELQVAEARLATRLTAIHPARASLGKQRALLEERLQQLTQAEAAPMPAFDPVRRNFALALTSAEAHQAALESQAAELAAQRAELAREIAVLAASRLEQPQLGPAPSATASSAVDSPAVGAEQLRVLQAATKSDRPIAPRPSVWLAAGLSLATLSSIVAVALAERRNPSFSRPDQISRRLGLPVLATVPRVQRNSA